MDSAARRTRRVAASAALRVNATFHTVVASSPVVAGGVVDQMRLFEWDGDGGGCGVVCRLGIMWHQDTDIFN